MMNSVEAKKVDSDCSRSIAFKYKACINGMVS